MSKTDTRHDAGEKHSHDNGTARRTVTQQNDPTVSAARTRLALVPRQGTLSLLFSDGDVAGVLTASRPNCRPAQVQVQAMLQSPRFQALRAEIKRCITMAMRMNAGERCNDDFRWTLSPTLFSGTTVVLRRLGDDWRLDVTANDQESHDVLAGGIGTLRRQFSQRNLGDIVVDVSVSVNKNEPFPASDERTYPNKDKLC